jgi:hypothetical protein
LEDKLHIVSFDVPYPADYGGAIDVFYKIKALHAQGYKIYLHCFEYGRGEAPGLAQYCEQVWYYKRTTGILGLSFTKPYIVSSRKSATLLKRLRDIDAPILFEGVHTTYYLSHPSLEKRFKAIRVHNIEHDYYELLSNKATSTYQKIYFKREANLLKKYEAQLGSAQAFYALSFEDHKYFKAQYPNAQHTFIPPFHQYDEVTIKEGSGTYCLYHGNLSHPENIEAAMYLLTKVFPFIDMPIIIAGKNPTAAIQNACNTLQNCTLVSNPGKAEMDSLIANAHIHVLPTFQQSGMKLKLLSALYGGRHVLVNEGMLYGTGMANDICYVCTKDTGFISAIKTLNNVPFTQEDISKRAASLVPYGNAGNAKNLIAQVFPEKM